MARHSLDFLTKKLTEYRLLQTFLNKINPLIMYDFESFKTTVTKIKAKDISKVTEGGIPPRRRHRTRKRHSSVPIRPKNPRR